jgi:hypothetical protein
MSRYNAAPSFGCTTCAESAHARSALATSGSGGCLPGATDYVKRVEVTGPHDRVVGAGPVLGRELSTPQLEV